MVSITHLDGNDVIVLDPLGRAVPAVTEVRVEPDRAVVAVTHHAEAWWQSLAELGPDALLPCAIHSRDGRQLHWRGPVRLACE